MPGGLPWVDDDPSPSLSRDRIQRGENTAYLEVYHLYYPAGTPDMYEEQTKPDWL
jgi:hypothetical protein